MGESVKVSQPAESRSREEYLNLTRNLSTIANCGSMHTVVPEAVTRVDSVDSEQRANSHMSRVRPHAAFKTALFGDPAEDENDKDRIDVTLRSDAFTYDKEHNTFTISLSNVEIVRLNEVTGKLTIKMKAHQINRDKSGRAEAEMDDDYV